MRLILFFLLFVSLGSFSQEERRNTVILDTRVTRIDFFLNASFHRQWNRWEPFAGAGAGIVRSIFQSRVFPCVGLGTTYNLLKREKIRLGPQVLLNYDFLRVNAGSGHITYWQEYQLGYRLVVGKRFLFTHALLTGPMLESFYGEYEHRYRTALSWGYSLQIGIGYAF